MIYLLYIKKYPASVAQWIRAPNYGFGGRGFESLLGYFVTVKSCTIWWLWQSGLLRLSVTQVFAGSNPVSHPN